MYESKALTKKSKILIRNPEIYSDIIAESVQNPLYDRYLKVINVLSTDWILWVYLSIIGTEFALIRLVEVDLWLWN